MSSPMTGGCSWTSTSTSFTSHFPLAYLSQKRSIIPIKNKDTLCCARAIVTAKARLDSYPKWNSIRQGKACTWLGNCTLMQVMMFLFSLSLSLSLSVSVSHVLDGMICMVSLAFFIYFIYFHTLISFIFSRPEWEQFQASLGPTYQLHVFSRDFFNAVVYEGPHKAENKLYIYNTDNHYSVINSMPTFVERIQQPRV